MNERRGTVEDDGPPTQEFEPFAPQAPSGIRPGVPGHAAAPGSAAAPGHAGTPGYPGAPGWAGASGAVPAPGSAGAPGYTGAQGASAQKTQSTSAPGIDTLFASPFGETDSRERAGVQEEPVPAEPAGRSRGAVRRIPKTERVLLWIAGCLAATLALIGLFALGTQFPMPAGSAATSAADLEPADEPVLAPGEPLPPGEYEWSALQGGECVLEFDSAWQQRFAVVDCGEPHAAQLLVRAAFQAGDEAPFPGAEQLQSTAAGLCEAPAVLDYAAAAAFDDLVIAASFAADEKQWAEGERDYFCFVARSSGETLTASLLAVEKPTE